MAYAVLASQNESSWAQSGGFMGKFPYSNSHLKNPNPRPHSKKKQKFSKVNGRHADDSPAVTQTASDDAYSFNQGPVEANNRNGFSEGRCITFNISSYTRSELKELRKRLVVEHERIRNLNGQIESGQFQPCQQIPGKIKKLSGNKRPHTFGSGKDSKCLSQPPENENGIGSGTGNENLMKMCRQVLTKLMKHKHSWIFSTPVDAADLGLHDYHQIVKRPMDLGTVKSNLVKNLYASSADFAADVRLVFNNAMLYNPKTDQVHGMAEQLLSRFEEMYRPIQEKIGGDRKEDRRGGLGDELQGSSWNHIPTPEKTKKPKPSPVPSKPDRAQNHSSASAPSNPPHPLSPPRMQSPVSTPSPVRAQPTKPVLGRGITGKLPKPRARDPNKREMSMEEKQKLGMGLQSLPQEKMPQLVQIIKKRNGHLAQEDDEIELDIEALDTETLWELDRFVTNWKKMVSKTKRQALMVNNSAASAATATTEANAFPVSEKMDSAKKPKKGEAGEEDVDIGDDMPTTNFPPLEIEKDDGVHVHDDGSSSSSSSSSSGSDSSSSSDSDSGSSSGSDSDADDAQS